MANKQAIVMIHGMGEQKPMDTIRGFARSVWTLDETAWPPLGAADRREFPNYGEVWSKPDARTGSLELRRLTTRENRKGDRSDFYELYWADQSGGSTWNQVRAWIWMLLWRHPVDRVPSYVRLAWILLWVVAIVAALLVIVSMLPAPGPTNDPWVARLWGIWPFSLFAKIPSWVILAIVGVMGFVAHHLIVPYFGRVVRYTSAVPDNIAARKAIRERGLALLNDLHRREYNRIVVVAHSLGSILAYDLISHFWSSALPARTVKKDTDEFEYLCELEKLAAEFENAAPGADLTALRRRYEAARRGLSDCLRKRPSPVPDEHGKLKHGDPRWLITDFVTVGSPLGHADFLLAHDRTDLESHKAEREFATAPPLREKLSKPFEDAARRDGILVNDCDTKLFSYWVRATGEWQLHHAAQFAVVRWTNIHDPAWLVLLGDQISTPCAPMFGYAIEDVDLRKLRGRSWWFTHTRYWNDAEAPQEDLRELRRALNLADEPAS